VTSGAEHVSKSKFWFQQRGGYTRMDEAGIDFGLNEKVILKKLETQTVFELEPEEKLKILTCLCHQLQSQTSFRDLIEDNFQKLSSLRAQLRDLQTDENRRLREETSERWRKKMQDKAQEKAKLEEIRQAKIAAAAGAAIQNNSSAHNESANSTTKPSKDRNSLGSNDGGGGSAQTAVSREEAALARLEEQARLLEEKQIIESNKRREEFLKRENKLNDDIYKCQLKCSMMPLGKDRFYRRYWVFKSVPGVFVENDTYKNLDVCHTMKSDEDDSVNTTNLNKHPHHQLNGGTAEPMNVDQPLKSEPNVTAAAEDSIEMLSSSMDAATSNNNSVNNDQGKENNPEQLAEAAAKRDPYSISKVKSETPHLTSSTFAGKKDSSNYWSFYCTVESVEALMASLSQRGIRESELKQSLEDLKDKLCDQLNRQQSAIIKNLTMSPEDIETSLKHCLKENVYNVLANTQNNSQNGAGNMKKAKPGKQQNAQQQEQQAITNSISAQECMEIDLRDQLVELQEQIYVGALGSLKCTDRGKWKEALAEGFFDPQCATLVWADQTRPAHETTNCTGLVNFTSIVTQPEDLLSDLTSSKHLGVVNNLAKVLLQIEQSIEKRFLRVPLGDSEKTPEKRRAKGEKPPVEPEKPFSYTVLHNWEKSLMYCTSLSQLFVHLQTLDESIAWSKSVMNAKCRLCNRKGDAEKMLLCDSCDRGHHIYCLRPPLSVIPDGEWFCPKCKPKTVEKTPRKIRKSFVANDDMHSDEETEAEDHPVKSGGGKGGKNSRKYESMDEDNEEDEEENNEATDDEYTRKSGAGKGGRGGKGAAAVKTSGHHVINGHVSEEDEESSDENHKANTSKKGAASRKRKLTEEIKQATAVNGKAKSVVSAAAVSKNARQIASSSLTSMASSTASSSADSGSLKRPAAAVSSSGRRTRQVDYQEPVSDHGFSGTDDDSGVTVSKKKKSTSSAAAAAATTVKASTSDFHTNDTSSRNVETTQRMKSVEALVNELMKHEDCWPFLKPVPKREVSV
jgi:bromodomain adjacent to zinc finger domain protein 1A